jgi:hypothetical protein
LIKHHEGCGQITGNELFNPGGGVYQVDVNFLKAKYTQANARRLAAYQAVSAAINSYYLGLNALRPYITTGEALVFSQNAQGDWSAERVNLDAANRVAANFTLDVVLISGGDMQQGYTFRADTQPKQEGLTYRWKIKEIPDTQNAHSNYLLDQEFLSGPSFTFKPDLAGRWKLVVEASDGKQTKCAEAVLWAERRILWIKHADQEITLETVIESIADEQKKSFNGVKILGIPGKCYQSPQLVDSIDFLQEVAHEQAGVYNNYDDYWMPVDEEGFYLPSDFGLLFKIRSGGKKIQGAYDGKHKSTDIRTQTMLFYECAPFRLASSAAESGAATIEVTVHDSGVTELVLPQGDYQYPKRIIRGINTALRGEYAIRQWVDFKSWRVNAESKWEELEKQDALGNP